MGSMLAVTQATKAGLTTSPLLSRRQELGRKGRNILACPAPGESAYFGGRTEAVGIRVASLIQGEMALRHLGLGSFLVAGRGFE